MIVVLVRRLLTPTVVMVCCFAQQSGKPACTARTQGMAWREQNARNACGEIQVCTLNVWKYRWQPVTVHVSQLAKNPKERRSACPSIERSVTVAPDIARSLAAEPLRDGNAERPATHR